MDRINIVFRRAKVLPAIFFLSSHLFSHSSHAQQYELGSTHVLVDILPEDAGELVKRADSCVHWQGEEGLDSERKQQIQQALLRFRCQNLMSDYREIEVKYKNDITLMKTLSYVKKYYLR